MPGLADLARAKSPTMPPAASERRCRGWFECGWRGRLRGLLLERATAGLPPWPQTWLRGRRYGHLILLPTNLSHTRPACRTVRLSYRVRRVVGVTSSNRKRISDPVTNRLFSLSGNQCAFPGCTNPVTEQAAPGEKPVTVGQRAHLVGVGRQGPRSKSVPLSDDLDAVENLTLFCGVCHPIVDNNPRIYSVEVLAKYKADHEARMAPRNLRAAPPRPETDTVDLSLLSVSELPGTLWKARSLFRTTLEVVEHLPRPVRTQVLPVVLLSGDVWAFHDLADRKGPFKHAVDASTAQQLDAAKILRSDDRNIYVWLLNSALHLTLSLNPPRE